MKWTDYDIISITNKTNKYLKFYIYISSFCTLLVLWTTYITNS